VFQFEVRSGKYTIDVDFIGCVNEDLALNTWLTTRGVIRGYIIQMQKWEYLLLELIEGLWGTGGVGPMSDSSDLAGALNELGQEGWEVTSVISDSRIILKRAKPKLRKSGLPPISCAT
jgi:hypothetical protein